MVLIAPENALIMRRDKVFCFHRVLEQVGDKVFDFLIPRHVLVFRIRASGTRRTRCDWTLEHLGL